MNKQTTHNLNINMYSLDELLGLFDLKYNMTLEDLRRAKKSVLMLHPDKSKLSPDYFLFYKKAFDIIVQYFNTEHKTNQPVTEENSQYKPLESQYNKSTVQKVKTMVNEMPVGEFQNKFNQLFEENMVLKPDQNKNEWFKKDEPIFKTSEQVSSKNMGKVFDGFKQQSADLIRYKGVQHMISSSNGSHLYDDNDDSYVTSDPFSKLKYDDLRKVHKDQTIFSVSERDYNNMPQYSSIDQYNRERSKNMGAPLEKQEAERLLSEQDQQFRQRMLQKQHADKLRTMEYEEKNKTIMSKFLHIGN
jgi:hypothetical protein